MISSKVQWKTWKWICFNFYINFIEHKDIIFPLVILMEVKPFGDLSWFFHILKIFENLFIWNGQTYVPKF